MASDSDSDEDFVTYGTPLEPLDEDEPLRKPVPVHEQTVKDEKGRFKRFHGAFTGGFSAGYFNTVGSKEGWAPSTFVSSRQQKAGSQNARPEDFMDEEDFGEHGIAPNEITTTDNFESKREDLIREKAKAVTSLSAPIPGDTLLEELIAPAKSSIGVQLLRKMGWKEGQGVGPRVKRKAANQRADSGPSRGAKGSEESEDDDDEEFAPVNVTFAPKDVTPIDFTPKVGLHGLGYRGLNPQQALRGGAGSGHINLFTLDSDRTASLFGDTRPAQRHRGGVAGQAFGVGAMEDDDEDIYHRDVMSNYDSVLGGEEPGDGLYGWTAPKQHKKKKDYSKDASYLGKILEGFTLASKHSDDKTVFPPPNLPRDYRPVHYFRPVVDLSSVSPIVAQALQTSRGHLVQEGEQQAGRHQLDSAKRRELLGEEAIQGPNSVFDLLKSEDKERLANLRNASKPLTTAPAPASAPPTVDSRAAMVSAGVAAAAARASAQRAMASRFQAPEEQKQEQQQQLALTAWSGPTAQAGPTFKPFEQNPSKQARYDLYVGRLRAGDRDALEQSLDPSMTEWERGRERDEFCRAAILYKPSGSFLSSRFTSAKQQDNDETVEVARDQENDLDDKQAAVTMRMFGKLTRDTFEWHPDKLLCKRFNIPDPYPESGTVGMPKVKRDKFSVFNFLNVSDPTASSSAPQAAPKAPESGKRSRWDMTGQKEVKTETDPLSEFLSEARNEASGSSQAAAPAPDHSTQTKSPEQQNSEDKNGADEGGEEEEEEESRPPMDLFKAIFAGSSDEKSSSSSEGESEKEEDEEGAPGAAASPLSSLFNITAKPSAPPLATPVPVVHQRTAMMTCKEEPIPIEEEEFGPKLPPRSSALTLVRPSPIIIKEEKHKKKCKEKHKAKKQQKHKKEKKKKKHKRHKHKGKQKKSKKEAPSSSSEQSTAESDGDTRRGEVSTGELLKRINSIRAKQF